MMTIMMMKYSSQRNEFVNNRIKGDVSPFLAIYTAIQ